MLVPTLLGVDLASYSVATSMYECFGLKSHAFGRYRCGISYFCDLIHTHHHPDLLRPEVARELLLSFAARQDKPCLLIPTTDWYVDLALKLRAELSEAFMLALPEPSHFYELAHKENLYLALDTYGIAHPKTKVFRVGESVEWSTFPAIVKPSCSYEAERCHFAGQRKVYIVENREGLDSVLALLLLYHRGLSYLLQPYMKAERSYVLTVLSQRNFGVRAAVLAEVAVEEIGDTSRGNYCALLVRELNETARRLIAFCDSIGYEGIVNFDIIRTEFGDMVLDMNMRVGRSVDYLRGAGHRVGDFLYKSQNRYNPYPERFACAKVLWRSVRDRELLKLSPPRLRGEIREKLRCGFVCSPYDRGVRRHSPVEWLYQSVHLARATRATALAYKR